jgi:hypothetical protein
MVYTVHCTQPIFGEYSIAVHLTDAMEQICWRDDFELSEEWVTHLAETTLDVAYSLCIFILFGFDALTYSIGQG